MDAYTELQTMERLHRIYRHPLYAAELEGICEDEKESRFCRHGMEHVLDVARICTIYCLKDGIVDEHITIELIYAAAMLHDIGRHRQNLDGTPHDMAGARIAEAVLKDCGFGEHEIRTVLHAITEHRREQNEAENSSSGRFADIFRMADKKSRPCYSCSAKAECNWPEEKMNLKVGI